MSLEALLTGIFALGLPAWLVVEQFVHSLRTSPRPVKQLSGRAEPGALRRVVLARRGPDAARQAHPMA
jgi:hypothetical protein